MSTLDYRTARLQYPHRPEMWEPEFLYEPLPIPEDHPELDIFGIRRAASAEEGNPLPDLPDSQKTSPPTDPAEPMRARMLNEFVYCPRLFYYEQVEGVFLDNADTERGSAIHEKIDRGRGALPKARKKTPPRPPSRTIPPRYPSPPTKRHPLPTRQTSQRPQSQSSKPSTRAPP
ncbi:MAG: hypothetical protein V4672_22025 [Verrucomicrobiota bacterium]